MQPLKQGTQQRAKTQLGEGAATGAGDCVCQQPRGHRRPSFARLGSTQPRIRQLGTLTRATAAHPHTAHPKPSCAGPSAAKGQGVCGMLNAHRRPLHPHPTGTHAAPGPWCSGRQTQGPWWLPRGGCKLEAPWEPQPQHPGRRWGCPRAQEQPWAGLPAPGGRAGTRWNAAWAEARCHQHRGEHRAGGQQEHPPGAHSGHQH